MSDQGTNDATAAPVAAPPTQVQLTLNTDGVIAPMMAAARFSTEAIALGLNAIAAADLNNIPNIPSSFSGIKFQPLEEEEVGGHRDSISDWLVARGFEAIVNGVRETLEQAYLYVSIFHHPLAPMTYGEFLKLISDVNGASNRSNFVDLLGLIRPSLTKPFVYEPQILSLQAARNCFVHRRGVVGPLDLKNGQELVLSIPNMKMFITEDGQEREIEQGMFIEKGEVISVRIELKEWKYTIGQRITISAKDFSQIAMSCVFMATDIASALPTK